MRQEQRKGKSFWKLLTAAAIGAVSVCAAQFGLWLVFFAVTSLLGVYLLTGMYFLAWPIVFPIYTFPVVFVLLLIIIPMLRKPYLGVLSAYHFWMIIILPVVLVAFTVMVATCPLDIGGNLWTRGFEAFGTD
ncbi:MAG: hypothetical protein JSW26_05825 [Desulfobacterales bacterium]|nr:MAG: hypothetical protein JSW26_05825 [Desulfobacterales bacterium]